MSCGALKKDQTKIEELAKTEESAKTNNTLKLDKEMSVESNVKKTENTTVDDQNETVTKETVYEPIDNSKPASVIDPDGKKTDLNNSKKTVKETRQKNNTKTDITKASEETLKSEEKAKLEAAAKSEVKKAAAKKKLAEESNLNREEWSAFNWFWLLIPVGAYSVWKNKKLIITKLKGLWV